jgi:hypothetical protein
MRSLNAQHVLRTSAEFPAAGITNSVTSAPDVTHELLTRIDRDGDMTTFGPERVSDPELKEWRLADFALTGAVWVLARTPSNKSYLLRFDAKGEYKGAVGLDADFYPQQLAHDHPRWCELNFHAPMAAGNFCNSAGALSLGTEQPGESRNFGPAAAAADLHWASISDFSNLR